MTYYSECSTSFSNSSLLELSGLDQSVSDASSSEGTPSELENTSDHSLGSCSSVSIESSFSELLTIDKSDCLKSDDDSSHCNN